MAVPAHDERDYAFAKKFGIDIIQVLEGGDITKEAYTQDGTHINSGFLDGLNKEDAINTMINWLEENKVGTKKVNYKLREWIFARQRYWGEPIPIVHTEEGSFALSEKELPLVLPELEDYSKAPGTNAPLDKATSWVNTEINGIKGKRETSTMPGSAASSWYFMRYIDPNNDKEFADQELLKHWLPVDLYLGGSEHAVGHLLYSRFWTKFLYDLGYSPVDEPFKKLYHQGMILGENGEKMSKSRGNVVNPDDVVKQYGADALRLYEMFMGPLDASLPWSTSGLEGAKKFIDRVYRLLISEEYASKIVDTNDLELEKIYHKTVKKVTEDYEKMAFNTAISQMMIFINEAYKAKTLPREYALGFIKMLSPICPHVCEEMWNLYGNNDTIAYEPWPTYDEAKTVDLEIEMAVQVNGKLRATLKIEKDADQEVVKARALELPNVIANTQGKQIRKIIVVPNRIVNIVVA